MEKILIKNLDEMVRLDVFLVKHLKQNRHFVNKLIKNNCISVDGEIINKNGFWLKNGHKLTIFDDKTSEFNGLQKYEQPVEIIYEDDNLIVVNKSKNILTHPTTFNEQNTLVNILLDKIKVNEFDDQMRPGVVHRLDRNTTGLLVIAKDKKTYENLIEQIHNRRLIRKYLALVHHRFKDDHLILKLPIIRSKTQLSKMTISDSPQAKLAITEIKVLKNFDQGNLIECLLLTGRTHQIRVHLSYIHHPIFNDPLYGTSDGYKNYDQFLHAHYLSFIHPISNKILEFHSKPDNIFMSLEKKLATK